MALFLRFYLAAALAVTATAAARAQSPVPILDIPYLTQSEALCGGAAAAMVMRYWGVRGIDAEAFAPLVDRSAAGIRTEALAAGVRARGFTALPVSGTAELARRELAAGRPVIALVEDRPGTYHYVVLAAWHAGRVIVHDPARAPYQVITEAAFDARWEVTGRWMLVMTPGAGALETPPPSVSTSMPAVPGCPGVALGVARAGANDLPGAERILSEAVLTCGSADALRELAGVRLLQKRWPEVEKLAAGAVRLDPGDAHAWRLLATSRFIQGQPRAALDAWNAAGEPTIDLVRIEGLHRTRYRVVERLLALETGTLLTTAALRRAERRLRAWPAASFATVDYTPVGSGRAEVRAVLAEEPARPRLDMITAAAMIARAAGAREVVVASASPTGGGERLEASWRFWPGRPRLRALIAVPGRGGIWRAAAEGERQPFTDDAIPPAARVGGSLAFEQWATSHLRWTAAAGADSWNGLGRVVSLAGGLETVNSGGTARAGGRIAVSGGEFTFSTATADAAWRSRAEPRGLVVQLSAAAALVTDATPLDRWPAGDTGAVRATLLRAHPALDDGRLRVERLGRAVVQGSVEAQHWWPLRYGFRIASAAFLDAARTSRRLRLSSIGDADAGVGVRLALPGRVGTLRVDVARGLRDGRTALSATIVDTFF